MAPTSVAPVLRRVTARPCRRPGRPPQAEGLPHRKPQIPGKKRCVGQKKVLTRGGIRSKVTAVGSGNPTTTAPQTVGESADSLAEGDNACIGAN